MVAFSQESKLITNELIFYRAGCRRSGYLGKIGLQGRIYPPVPHMFRYFLKPIGFDPDTLVGLVLTLQNERSFPVDRRNIVNALRQQLKGRTNLRQMGISQH